MLPANDNVALVRIVTMRPEIPGLILELDSNALPHTRFATNLAFGFAVWESRLHDLHDVTEFAANHAKQENDPLLINRPVLKTSEVYEFTVDIRSTCLDELMPRMLILLRRVIGLGV